VLRSLVEDKAHIRVLNMITTSVETSFILCPCRMTHREIKRRFELAWDIFKSLRAECRFPLARIEDALPHYLRMAIEGVEWHPLKRRTWVPGDPVALGHFGMK
jgi:hypothetical protein